MCRNAVYGYRSLLVRYYNKVRNKVCSLCIQCYGQVSVLFLRDILDIVVLNQGLTDVNHFNLFRDDIHSRHLMVLGKQRGNRQSNITGTHNHNFIIPCPHKIHLLCKAHSEPFKLYKTVYSLHCGYHFYPLFKAAQNKCSYQLRQPE